MGKWEPTSADLKVWRGPPKKNRRGSLLTSQLKRAGRRTYDREEVWKTLQSAVEKMLERKDLRVLSFEELYRYVYRMCEEDYEDFLYSGLEKVVRDHLVSVQAQVEAAPQSMFLNELQRQWNWFEISITNIGDIFYYADHKTESNGKKSTREISISLFREMVLQNANVGDRLFETMLDQIDRERNGEQIDCHVLNALTKLLLDLGQDSKGRDVYAYYLERPLLERTAEYYRNESKKYLCESTHSAYLRRMERRILEETKRVEMCLDSRTLRKLKAITEDELLRRDIEQIMEMPNSGFRWLLQNDKFDDINHTYRLYSDMHDGEWLLRKLLKDEVVEKGMELVNNVELCKDHIGLIDAFLNLKIKYDKIAAKSFVLVNDEEGKLAEVDKSFTSSINEAFEKFLNDCQPISEYLSLYVDKLLRLDFRGASDEEMEDRLDVVVALFRHLHEKDVFERYYKQHLAKRLLFGRSVSEDAERSFAIKLREECGSFYTYKLEGMFNDMRTSTELNTKFTESLSEEDEQSTLAGIGLNVTILTRGVWPTTQTLAVSVPDSITRCLERYVEFYNSCHSKRVLTWHHSMGTGELRAEFESSRHELLASFFQMSVLMLFNNADRLSYVEIANASKIPQAELQRTLQSLACAKYKILTKNPKGRDINNDDEFDFNKQFTNRSYRIRIPTISFAKETDDEKAVTHKRIEHDRKPQIEAAIMRIMKDRKELEHNVLVSEVTKQLMTKFRPNVTDIKRRIESLIDREFLTRLSDRVYKYIT
eukprot:Plantae.Rhodophyta-Purpureofilum_apyrenoidigerum.ctg4379.p1 GENE.Plantae.Rhodophyta-Purpureofilum_apyrenoidigerum.ctg4379~~Plantae.Rhodophyta-Purpureofilum_apyrenoidigerum.ctg4379.p1  ORF type:complete len:774 (+),score=184.12 Plantae.Rhodophyta-Purpureofilum_apyrenoidigerum.ctg4379:27-2324(+)